MTHTERRRFQGVKIDPKVKCAITDVQGKVVTINIRSMNDDQERILAAACDAIEDRLKGTVLERPIAALTRLTGFLVTKSPHVFAYSKAQGEDLIVILNEEVFHLDPDEMAVTVLHELAHFITKHEGHESMSREEAEHDLMCYHALGVEVPAGHWALKKFPDLADMKFDFS